VNTLVEMFTDGACRGNPGPGGWGVLLRCDDSERELSRAVSHTTTNRMEMQAAIEGLAALTRPCRIRLTTDSEYLCRGITEWLAGWKARGWKTAARKAVKNMDLWQRLDVEAARHASEWHWVRGHTGHPGNERADALATAAIDRLLAGGPVSG